MAEERIGLWQLHPPTFSDEEFRETLKGLLEEALRQYEADPIGFTQRWIAQHYGQGQVPPLVSGAYVGYEATPPDERDG